MTMPMSHIACEGAPSARAQRGTLLVAGLAVWLCLADLGFIDARAIAQEFVGEHRWRTAKGPTVLMLEEEKAAKPGSEFKECANGCPVMIVIPAGKFTMGSPKDELDRQASEGPQHEVRLARAIRRLQVRGGIRRMGCLRCHGWVPASRRPLGTWADAGD